MSNLNSATMSDQRGEASITTSHEEKMRSALVVALFQPDPGRTFKLDTTPEEKTLFDVCLNGDLALVKLFLRLAVTEKLRPYDLTKLSIFSLRIMNIIAVKSGHAEIVEYLLSIAQRVNIVHRLFINRDTINAAVSSDNVEVLRS